MNSAPVLFEQLGISLMLGLLVGLQRQRTAPTLPGVRTFPLITLLGTLCGILASAWGGWMVAAGLLGVVAVAAITQFVRLRQEGADLGTTTEVAMLVMFATGALLAVGPLQVAIAIGGGVAVLLHLKPEMHRFAARLGDDDLKAIMQFVAITCIILPILPNRAYGPLGVLNPFETWLIVVLVVGLSLGGYILYKFFGRDAGILLGGLLGGAISSTATTVSYARQAQSEHVGVRPVSVVILIATAVSFVRVLVVVAIIGRANTALLEAAAGPLLILAVLSLLPALFLWFRVRKGLPATPAHENPSQLQSAVVFGLLYSLVLFALAAAKRFAGGQALFVVAGLSGLTDMDAITISTARMALNEPKIAHLGWQLIVVAGLANLVSKTVLSGLLGGRRLAIEMAMLFSIPLIGGITLLLLG